MPPRKRSDPPPISTASSRRTSNGKTVKNLSNTGATTRKIPSCSVTGQCGCNEVGCGPGTCCTKDNQCGQCPTPDNVQDLCSQKCEKDVEAMIDEMQCCREMIRALAQETMDMLKAKIPKHDCGAATQNDPAQHRSSPKNTLSKGSCSAICNASVDNLVKSPTQVKPINQRQNSGCSNKKCEATASRILSGIERRSASQSQQLPPKSPSASKRSSNSRIALTAFQKSDGRLGKKENCHCAEQRMKRKSSSLVKTPSDCSCDKKEKNCKGQKTPEQQLSDCSCNELLKKQGIKTDSKNCFPKMFGDKTSDCSCEAEKGNETEAKKGDSRSCLDKAFGRKSTDNLHVAIDECKNKVECVRVRDMKPKIDINKRIRPTCSVPTCAANTCTCHFPPEYGQYFDCTGHVAGNCDCDKNA